MHSPTSIQTRQARKRSVTVILAQRENPLIEISAILTQCDRALKEARCSTKSASGKASIALWRPTKVVRFVQAG